MGLSNGDDGVFLFGALLGEVFAICGSCSALGNWNPQAAVVLQTDDRQVGLLVVFYLFL